MKRLFLCMGMSLSLLASVPMMVYAGDEVVDEIVAEETTDQETETDETVAETEGDSEQDELVGAESTVDEESLDTESEIDESGIIEELIDSEEEVIDIEDATTEVDAYDISNIISLSWGENGEPYSVHIAGIEKLDEKDYVKISYELIGDSYATTNNGQKGYRDYNTGYTLIKEYKEDTSRLFRVQDSDFIGSCDYIVTVSIYKSQEDGNVDYGNKIYEGKISYKYNRPSKYLDTPKNVKFDGKNILFDKVNNADRYQIVVWAYRKDDGYKLENIMQYTWWSVGAGVSSAEYDLSRDASDLKEWGYDEVYVTVKALSNDINVLGNSYDSAPSKSIDLNNFQGEKKNGIYYSNDGNRYLYKDDAIVSNFNGVYSDSTGKYYIENGKLDSGYTGVAKDSTTGKWIHFSYGTYNPTYTGISKNPKNGNTYYCKNGEVDWSCTSLMKETSTGKWYYVIKGQVDYNYVGLAKNVANGRWYYVNKGAISWNFTGLAKNPANGHWYYVTKGEIDWKYTGLAKNAANGNWYYVKNGEIDFKFTGIAKNAANGNYYYVKAGQLDWKYNNAKVYDSATKSYYKVVNGLATKL